MPYSGCLSLHGVNPNLKNPYEITQNLKMTETYSNVSQLPSDQITAQLYNLSDDFEQKSILNIITNIFL